MRTVTFRSVLWGLATMAGMDPRVDLMGNQAAAFTEYINTRLREFWLKFECPDLEDVEERAFADDYDSTVSYEADAVVWSPDDGKYYKAKTSSLGESLSDENYWEETADIDRIIPLEQVGKTSFGEILEVYAEDPETKENPLKVSWLETRKGIRVYDIVKTVWVRFQLWPAVFTSEAWLPSVDYSVGDLVYNSTTGECYKAKVVNSNTDTLDSAIWEKIDFPEVLSAIVKRAAFSDVLREEGQPDKATIEEQVAEDLFIQETDRYTLRRGATSRFTARVK